MAELYRKRYNGVDSVTLGGSLTNVATSITFAAALQSMGANIATLATDEYLPLVIDNEIIYLTAYTAAATTGTISRGKEGTTGAAHSNGAAVLHGATVLDFSSTVAYAAASSTLVTTASSQDVAGATVSVVVDGPGDVYLATAFFDFDIITGAAAVIAIGLLTVDGVDQSAIATYNLQTGLRGTVGQQWRVTGLAAGAKVFKLRGVKTSAGGTANINATHTTIAVQRIS